MTLCFSGFNAFLDENNLDFESDEECIHLSTKTTDSDATNKSNDTLVTSLPSFNTERYKRKEGSDTTSEDASNKREIKNGSSKIKNKKIAAKNSTSYFNSFSIFASPLLNLMTSLNANLKNVHHDFENIFDLLNKSFIYKLNENKTKSFAITDSPKSKNLSFIHKNNSTSQNQHFLVEEKQFATTSIPNINLDYSKESKKILSSPSKQHFNRGKNVRNRPNKVAQIYSLGPKKNLSLAEPMNNKEEENPKRINSFQKSRKFSKNFQEEEQKVKMTSGKSHFSVTKKTNGAFGELIHQHDYEGLMPHEIAALKEKTLGLRVKRNQNPNKNTDLLKLSFIKKRFEGEKFGIAPHMLLQIPGHSHQVNTSQLNTSAHSFASTRKCFRGSRNKLHGIAPSLSINYLQRVNYSIPLRRTSVEFKSGVDQVQKLESTNESIENMSLGHNHSIGTNLYGIAPFLSLLIPGKPTAMPLETSIVKLAFKNSDIKETANFFQKVKASFIKTNSLKITNQNSVFLSRINDTSLFSASHEKSFFQNYTTNLHLDKHEASINNFSVLRTPHRFKKQNESSFSYLGKVKSFPKPNSSNKNKIEYLIASNKTKICSPQSKSEMNG